MEGPQTHEKVWWQLETKASKNMLNNKKFFHLCPNGIISIHTLNSRPIVFFGLARVILEILC